MGAYLSAARILTDRTMNVLQQEAIDLEKYRIFYVTLSRHLDHIYPYSSRKTFVDIDLVSWVCEEVDPKGIDEHGATWADFATIIRHVLTTAFGAHFGDGAMPLRVAVFARNMSSAFRGTVEVVRQRIFGLAVSFVQFILDEAGDVAADKKIPEEGEEAEEVVAEGPPDTEVVAEEPPEAEQEEEIVTEAHPEPEVDEDGDETKEKSGSRGSKRRSQGLSYKEELKRESEAKRCYGLRDTRAREERMAKLKDVSAKQKVDSGAGSSSKGAKKKSRR